jgi:uncharacterized protein YoxC
MQTLLNWFGGQSHLVSSVQIVLDLTLIIVVVLFIKGRRKTSADGENASQSLDQVIAETKAIAQELDANMRERQQLIRDVVQKLDQRLEEARGLCERLDSLNREAQSSSPTQASTQRQSGQNEIVRLARLGLDAGAISERLQKPVGEVELVLSLKRLTPER